MSAEEHVVGDNAEPRWLEREETEIWFTFGTMVTWLPDVLDAQLQRDAGISFFEYQVMSMLSMSPRRTRRMSELAALASGSLTRLSRTVDRLHKRGWVIRRPDPENGRFTLAVLTDAGWDKVVATAPGHVEEVRRVVFDPLTKAQLRQLRDISTRIGRTVHPDGCLPTLPTPEAAEVVVKDARP
jgi:DNA-binding MarR family transcriptional regulator